MTRCETCHAPVYLSVDRALAAERRPADGGRKTGRFLAIRCADCAGVFCRRCVFDHFEDSIVPREGRGRFLRRLANARAADQSVQQAIDDFAHVRAHALEFRARRTPR